MFIILLLALRCANSIEFYLLEMNVLAGLSILVSAGLAAAGSKDSQVIEQFKVKRIKIILSSTAVPDLESRIVGGDDARPGQFPYMASIRRDSGIFMCGAAIIRPRWILTAASCFEGLMHTEIFVVVGTHLLSTGGIRHEIRSFEIHPRHIPDPLANDIALVQLDPPVTYTDLVQPIQPASIRFGGQLPAVVTGWGFTEVSCNTGVKLYKDII